LEAVRHEERAGLAPALSSCILEVQEDESRAEEQDMGWFSKNPIKITNAIADSARRDVQRLDALKLKPAAGRQRAAGSN
jgi:hypothetical protein